MKHPASCNFSQTCVHLISKNDLKFGTVFSLLFRHIFYDQAKVQNPSTKSKVLDSIIQCDFFGLCWKAFKWFIQSPFFFSFPFSLSHNYQM